jgi:cell shape-determining protein MreD
MKLPLATRIEVSPSAYTGPTAHLTLGDRVAILIGLWPLLTPTFVTIVLMLVMAIPISGIGPWFPNLGLISVLYWSIHHPRVMPPWNVFLLACLNDLWSGAALGPSALVWLVLSVVLSAQYVMFRVRPFWFEFVCVGGAALVGHGALWGLTQLVLADAPALTLYCLQAMLSLFCYPASAALHSRVWHWAVERRFQ